MMSPSAWEPLNQWKSAKPSFHSFAPSVNHRTAGGGLPKRTRGGCPSRPRGCGPSVTSTLRLGTFSPRYDRLTQPQKRRSPPKGLLGRLAPYLGFRHTSAWGLRRCKGCLEGGRGPKRFLSRLCCDILSITLFGLIVQRV